MSNDDLTVVFEYRSAERGSIQNWRGPGWYAHASTSDNHGTFAVEPRQITPQAAQDLAAAFGSKTVGLVRQQQERGRRQLVERITRLEEVERQLASARSDLAAFEEETP